MKLDRSKTPARPVSRRLLARKASLVGIALVAAVSVGTAIWQPMLTLLGPIAVVLFTGYLLYGAVSRWEYRR